MEKELSETQNEIALLQNLKECYTVKLYYLGNNSSNFTESEINELKLQRYSLQDSIQNLTIRLSQLTVHYENLYAHYIESKKLSMQDGHEHTAG